ncbi:IS3 family transposase [Curtobacterium sp. MCSS17_005]|uniref:IS3 family transposase n=1 Tax=Curtobacterium sp. MCSS17_005 TaxID=2175641 RepID=UPI0021ACE86D|nr:IS3 family transposase [Curtobacterium sp. MCSS17_005]WIB34387.1 IS3 family transposase [Curtobacterium sp. MCSS17_005]
MVKAYPEEFRRDVIAVARKGETSVRQVAKDFGVSESCLARWLRLADRDDGVGVAAVPSAKAVDQAELRDAQKRIRLLEQENEILRRAAAYFAQSPTPKMIYPLVLELADGGVPVAVACRVLGFSKQAFYRWRADPVTERDWADAHLTNAAIDAHRDDPTFGYRFIADDLHAAGHRVSERRVWRLCSQQRLWSLHAKKRGLNRKAGPPVHDDRVRRAFTAPDLDKLWLTDITEHPTGEGKLYLCAIKDACSRRIVGYSIGDHMRSSLAVATLRMAVHRRNPTGTVVHSDRGSQDVFNRSSQQLLVVLSVVDRRRCSAPGLMEALNPREDESHGSTEEVPGGASGAGGEARGGRAPRPEHQTWRVASDR